MLEPQPARSSLVIVMVIETTSVPGQRVTPRVCQTLWRRSGEGLRTRSSTGTCDRRLPARPEGPTLRTRGESVPQGLESTPPVGDRVLL
jgi:hypothetical protein